MPGGAKTLISLFLLACVTHLTAQTTHSSVEKIKREHEALKKIVLTIGNRSLLDDPQKFIAGLSCCGGDRRDLGFGCTYLGGMSGDSFTTRFSIVTYRGKVMQYVIDYTDDAKHLVDSIIAKDTVIKNVVSHIGNIKKKKSFTFLNQEVYNTFKNEVARFWGQAEPTEIIDSEDSKNYLILAEPIYRYDVGMICYYSGEAPMGSVAIEYFTRKRKVDVIRSLIRKYNPEGRIYAINALLDMASQGEATLTNNDIITIKKVLSLDIPIHTCHGCILQHKKAVDVVGEARLSLLR